MFQMVFFWLQEGKGYLIEKFAYHKNLEFSVFTRYEQIICCAKNMSEERSELSPTLPFHNWHNIVCPLSQVYLCFYCVLDCVLWNVHSYAQLKLFEKSVNILNITSGSSTASVVIKGERQGLVKLKTNTFPIQQICSRLLWKHSKKKPPEKSP